MHQLNRQLPSLAGLPRERPERVLQIGEGRFIRAFVDWLLMALNEADLFDGSVVLTPARAHGRSKIEALRAQDGLFTVWTRGFEAGMEVDRFDLVSVVSRVVNPFEDWEAFLRCAEQRSIDIVVSNTTELGISYVPTPQPLTDAPATFPARLTAYLAHRYGHFGGDPDVGMAILPTELIDNNGAVLRAIVLQHAQDWGLGADFAAWIEDSNAFCNTLVDRIVPGMPEDPLEGFSRLGYTDSQLVVAEPFYLWAIDADPRMMWRLPFQISDLHVQFTDNLDIYRIQKLRVLNGTHTFLASLGTLIGCQTVREAMTHQLLGPLTRSMVERVTVSYSELDEPTLRAYADSVFDRFLNPFIEHRLRDISQNALAKFRIRLLPVLSRYASAQRKPPEEFSLCLAALFHLYKPESNRHPDDESPTVAIVQALWKDAETAEEAISAILGDQRLFQEDLRRIPGLQVQVSGFAEAIENGELDAILAGLLARSTSDQ